MEIKCPMRITKDNEILVKLLDILVEEKTIEFMNIPTKVNFIDHVQHINIK